MRQNPRNLIQEVQNLSNFNLAPTAVYPQVVQLMALQMFAVRISPVLTSGRSKLRL